MVRYRAMLQGFPHRRLPGWFFAILMQLSELWVAYASSRLQLKRIQRVELELTGSEHVDGRHSGTTPNRILP